MATIRDLRARFTATAQGFKSTVDGIKNDLDQVGEAGADSSQKANDGFGTLKTTLLGFAGAYLGFEAIKGAVGGVISITDEYQTSLNSLQTKTGATKEEMVGMEESLKNIYGNNYGDSFTDIADSMSLVATNTGLTGKALEDTTTKAIMLRDTFEFDIAQSTSTADTMMKQFGITSDQAFTLMAQGQQNGLNKGDDMLDSFNEYSVYFKQLGYDAEGMWDVYNAGIDAGVMNTDVIGDTIKEFGILAKDGSKATGEAFAGLGLDADKMSQAIAKGGPSAQKAMQQTFEALGKIKDPVERNALGVSLFGGKFEDLEHKAVMALGNVKSEANMSADTLKKIDEVKYNNIGSAFEGFKRQIIVGLLEPIQTLVMPMLNEFVNFAKQNMPQIKDAIAGAFTGIATMVGAIAPTLKNLFDILVNVGSFVLPILATAFGAIMIVLTPIVEALTGIIAKFTAWSGFAPLVIGLATAFGVYMAITKASTIATNAVTFAVKAWAMAQKALNLVMALNPIGIVVALIAGLVMALIYAYQHSETFRNIVQKAWEMIKTTVMGVINWFMTAIPVWIAGLVSWFTGLGAKLSAIWQTIWTGITGIWKSIVSTVVPLVTGFVKSVVDKAKQMGTNIMNFISPLITFFKNTWTNIKLIVLGIIGVFLNLITGNFKGLKISLLAIWTGIKDQVINVITMLKNMGMNIFNVLKSGVINIVNALKSGAVNGFNALKNGAISAWNALKSGAINSVNALKNGVINTVSAIKNGVTNGFNGAKTTAINAFNSMKTGVGNAINGVKKFVTDMKSNIVSTIKGINLFQMGKDVIQGFINGIKNMVGAVGSAIKSVAEGVTSKIKGALGIKSPSRVLMAIGEFTGEGLGIGIEKMKGFVQKASQRLADASFGTINSAELNPITATVDGNGMSGQGGHGGTNYNAPLQHIENYYQNTETDVKSLSNGLYNLQRNSDRKKGK